MNAKNAVFPFVLLAAVMVVGCSKDESSPMQPAAGPQATVLTATGDIAAKVAEFRTLLGDPSNGGTPGPLPAGRREVNWDGAAARPFNNQNGFPNDFFNTTVKSGLVYDGGTFRNDSLSFAEINPTYANDFKPFSPKVMFSAIGGHVIDAVFQIPGAATPAVVTGFGAVFSDVDVDQVTSIELSDQLGRSLGRFFVPLRSDVNGLSFLGVKFDAAVVASVHIVCGNGTLAAGTNDVTDGGTVDLVVVDNFIFGEPAAIVGTTIARR
jgi:hypothetical protein